MDESAAYSCALRILSRRDHSAFEIKRKLEARGCAPDVLARVIARLQENRYLDDRRVAFRLAEQAVANRKCVGPALRFELARRGIPAELAGEALDSVAAGYDEWELLREIVDRRFPGFGSALATPVEQRKVFNYLRRKGFSSDLILRMVRQIGNNWVS